jgi:hypothetical protein
VADDAVDDTVKVMKAPLVCFSSVVGKEIVYGEHDLRAAPMAELNEPEIERKWRHQHWKILHVNDVGRRDEKTYCECRKIKDRLHQLGDPARQARQLKFADDVEKTRVESNAAAGKAGGIEVIGDRAHGEIDVFGKESTREICGVVGHGRP